jgi:hypothetical protein
MLKDRCVCPASRLQMHAGGAVGQQEAMSLQDKCNSL